MRARSGSFFIDGPGSGVSEGGIVTEIRGAVCNVNLHSAPIFPIPSAHNFALLPTTPLRFAGRVINAMISAGAELELPSHKRKLFQYFYSMETSDEWLLFIRRNPATERDPRDE